VATTEYLTIPHLNTDRIRRIFHKIRITPNGCWEWTASGHSGYGSLTFRRKGYLTHRFMYAWLVAPIPIGLGGDIPQLDHLCRNRRCCNPAHLELVSLAENLRRGIGPHHRRRTHCINGHPMPEARLSKLTGRMERRCILCQRGRLRAHYWANRDRIGAERRAKRAEARQVRILPAGDGPELLNKP
jgi:hypothetical protein